jgi:two-component system, cell cycle response regulator
LVILRDWPAEISDRSNYIEAGGAIGPVGTVRAVVVDPSRVVLKCVSQLLAARNYEVRTFADGREALEYVRRERDVGVVITSTQPISISGAELCREARRLADGRRPIHIIVMSSNDDQKHLVAALDGGADDFIRKPPAAEELYARLRCAERLASMQRQLIRLATTDPLTGVLNRRAFFERGEEAVAAAAAGAALCAIMLDADHFKRVNDEHGHDVGDRALRGLARAVGGECAAVGRLGGEEFAILLPGAGRPDAVRIAEGLRAKIAALRIETASGTLTLTCSFGVSEWVKDDTIDRLLRRADAGLYEAKRSGRDRVVVAEHAAELAQDNPRTVIRSSNRR